MHWIAVTIENHLQCSEQLQTVTVQTQRLSRGPTLRLWVGPLNKSWVMAVFNPALHLSVHTIYPALFACVALLSAFCSALSSPVSFTCSESSIKKEMREWDRKLPCAFYSPLYLFFSPEQKMKRVHNRFDLLDVCLCSAHKQPLVSCLSTLWHISSPRSWCVEFTNVSINFHLFSNASPLISNPSALFFLAFSIL